MGCSVRELLARFGADELTEWLAFYQIEPFGDYRADVRSGVVAATFANANRGKDAKPFTPEDFMPFVERPEPVNDPKTNAAMLRSLFAHKVIKNG